MQVHCWNWSLFIIDVASSTQLESFGKVDAGTSFGRGRADEGVSSLILYVFVRSEGK